MVDVAQRISGVRFQLSLQPQLFRQLGQVLQCLFRFLLLLGLVAAQLFKFDAAVAVDLAAFQTVRLNLFNDERTRHIEEVGRLLCRQFQDRRFVPGVAFCPRQE
jgi:hypothetical protein